MGPGFAGAALGTLEQTLGQLRFGPDGCTLDAENKIWSADEVNARCARIAEGGEVIDEIPAPEGLNIFACALGGPDGRTLLASRRPTSTSRRAPRRARRCCSRSRSTCRTRAA